MAPEGSVSNRKPSRDDDIEAPAGPVRGTDTAVYLRSPIDEEADLRSVPVAFRDRTFLESIPVATWARILTAAGEDSEKLTIDYDAIDNDEFFLGLQQHSSDVEIVE